MTTSVLALDVDGVVVTGHKDGGRWDQNLERDLKIRPEILQQRFFKPHWPAIMIGEKDTMASLRGVWDGLGGSGTPEALVDYWFAADSRIDMAVVALADGWRAKWRKVYLTTNQERCRARYLWDDLGLNAHFDSIFYSADLRAQKPELEFFRRTQDRIGAQARDIIFADDRMENVQAANAQGWRGILYRRLEDLRAALDID